MIGTLAVERLDARIDALLARRTDANRRFFDAQAERLALLCRVMAARFAGGGRLLALGRSPAARSDARHVAVEFVHPVIVGKRALPAIALTGDGAGLSEQVRLLARERDIAMAFGVGQDGGEAARALELARLRGCLTIAFAPSGAEWELVAPTEDPFVAQELVETLYHLLWELVHVFLEHRGQVGGLDRGGEQGAGALGFLYPFLGDTAPGPEELLADVRRSVLMKAQDVGSLRIETLTESRPALIAAARALRGSFARGGTLLALGNGGSATDAMDVVADFRAPLADMPPRPAVDLTEDGAIITAIANDVGGEAIFSRQVIAYGRAGDALLAISTSGSSANVTAALAEARRRGLATIAMVGYDGGRVAGEQLADHVVITRSEYIPRIQEAQASACHVLRELVELAAVP